MSETKQQLEDIAVTIVDALHLMLVQHDRLTEADPARILELLRAADQAIETANKLDS